MLCMSDSWLWLNEGLYSHCLRFDNSDRKFSSSLTLVEILKQNKTREKDISTKDILTKIDNRHTFQKHWTKTQFPAGWAEMMDWCCLCWALPLFAFLRTGFSVQFPSLGSMRDIHWTSHINTNNIIWVYIMIFTILPAICPKACI